MKMYRRQSGSVIRHSIEIRYTLISLLPIRFFALVFILIFGLTDSSIAQAKKPKTKARPVPGITKKLYKAAVDSDEAESKTFGLTVENYVNNIVVERDGSSEQIWEILERAKTKRAVDTLKRAERVFNRDLEEVNVTDAYILKAGGRRITLPATAIETKLTPQTEAAPSFSSLMMIAIKFDGLEIGDAIHYKFTLRTKKTYFDGHFDRADYLASVYDWNAVEINLSAPVDYPIYTQAVGLDGGRLPDDGKQSRWQWRKSELKAVEIEPLMLDVIGNSPRVMMTSFASFEDLGKAYWKEASKKTLVTPEIKAQADEITKNVTNPEDQAYAIYQWVNKNIRYLFLVIDRNGWIPHDAGEILANRYGDCKDYTTILNALLKAKGIDSYPVIIRADMGDWFPNVAVPAYFNHAVLYIPSLNLFADATEPNTRLGLIPQQIIAKKGFLAGEKTGVIETPRNQPETNQIISKTVINLAPNGNVKATSVNRYVGQNEILFRPLFAGVDVGPSTFVKTILAYYGQTGKGKILKVSDPFKVRDPFEVEAEVELENYTTFTPSGSFRIPIGLNFNNPIALGDIVKQETRRSNLSLGAFRFQETYNIKFPDGVEIATESLTNSSLSNVTGSYKREFKVNGREVEVLRELTIFKDNITPDEYPMVRELITKAVESFQTEIKYTADPRLSAGKIVAKQTKSTTDWYSNILDEELDRIKGISAAEAKRLENKLTKDPSDADAHIKLVGFYSNFEVKDTKIRATARTRHRLWLIENRPEMSDDDIIGFRFADYKPESAEYALLKAAWLKQIEANKSNIKIRINAFHFLKKNDQKLAVEIITEGLKIDPDSYELPLALQKMYHVGRDGVVTEKAGEREARKKSELELGDLALSILKKERSHERDIERRKLLQELVKVAFELNKNDKARSMATELVLDFGHDSAALGYDDAAHIGNIILGRIELRQKNITKAKEYLLISIRAPLRKKNSWLEEIDTILAKELFEAGERDVVIDYFKLCLGLSNLTTEKNLFENQSRALKLWQEQIIKGKTPSFDFYKY